MKIRTLLLSALLLTLTGCANWNKYQETTSDPKTWGAFHPGEEYTLQKPVYLMREVKGDSAAYPCDPVDRPYARDPAILPPAIPSPTAMNSYPQIDGILHRGTHLRAVKTARTADAANGEVLLAVLDGQFQGRLIGAKHLALAAQSGQPEVPDTLYLVEFNAIPAASASR